MNKDFWKLYNLLLEENTQVSDAVIWLQGDRFDRAKNVLKIYKSKLAKFVIISGNNILIGIDKRIGENNIGLSEMYDYLLKKGVEKNDIIIDDEAFNTKDQAVHIMSLAKEKKWGSIVLVSSAYNQPRALLTFLRQMKMMNLSIKIYSCSAKLDMEGIPGGRSEKVKELCLSEINKIQEYKNDLLPISAGIEYIKNIKL